MLSKSDHKYDYIIQKGFCLAPSLDQFWCALNNLSKGYWWQFPKKQT